MTGLWIWGGALVLYGAFSLWYANWRGALRHAEVEAFVERLRASAESPDDERLAAFRAFLEADDGREFFMVNLVRLHDGEIESPGTGERQPPRRVLEGYTSHFMKALFRRAGHPALLAPARGGYLERWGVEKDPGWSFAGVIRYRSRRDLAELATDPAFAPAHAYKIAAIANTFAFPASGGVVPFGARGAVALVLGLAAALCQLAAGALRS